MKTRLPFSHRRAGFTLIEMLVTVAVMVLLVGGAMAGFITFRDRQLVLADAKSLQQFVRTAQAKARVRETPAACNTAGNRLQGYRVRFNSATSVTMHPLCGDDDLLPTPTERASVASLIITASAFSGYPTTIDFYTLHRDNSLASNTRLRASTALYRYCFDVGTGGSISEVYTLGC